MKHYKDKVIITNRLERVQADIEARLEVSSHSWLNWDETVEEKKKVMEDHVQDILKVKNFLHELWDDYAKLLKEKNENLSLL